MTLKETLEKERLEAVLAYEKEQFATPLPSWAEKSSLSIFDDLNRFYALFEGCEDF